MNCFRIRGGNRLSGRVTVSGSKNSALPIIFAALTLDGISVIHRVPDIGDVRIALELISDLGAEVRTEGDTVYIDTKNRSYRTPCKEKTAKIRASTYLIGSCLSAFGIAEISDFGGCNFSLRPIDLHIYSAERLGAALSTDGKLLSGKLHSGDIFLPKRSVGATVNALIMSASCEGVSRIYGYAKEPHIMDLICFLRGAGAKITECGDFITVIGTHLCGSEVTLGGDMIEAGTYLAASLLFDGAVRVDGFDIAELSAFCRPLTSSGATLTAHSGGSFSLSGKPGKELNVRTDAYPGFPTDLQPIMAALMARCQGGVIEETVWRDRFGYLSELQRLGVNFTRYASGAHIYSSEIVPAECRAVDLRGGAAALLLALTADGESIIGSADTVCRGYEKITEKLRRLGADIVYA